MLSWSRTNQAVKLAPMATIWCKVDGVIFNDSWSSVFVTPESFKICMIFIAGCWVSVGNVWNHFLIVAAEKRPGWYCLSTGEEASKISETESNETSSSPSEINSGVLRAPSAASGSEGADASWGGNILDNFCWVVSSVFLYALVVVSEKLYGFEVGQKDLRLPTDLALLWAALPKLVHVEALDLRSSVAAKLSASWPLHELTEQ